MDEVEWKKREEFMRRSSKFATMLTLIVDEAQSVGIVPRDFRVIPKGTKIANHIVDCPFVNLEWFGPDDHLSDATDTNSSSIDCESNSSSSSVSVSIADANGDDKARGNQVAAEVSREHVLGQRLDSAALFRSVGNASEKIVEA